jgi:hypothetical protein
MLYIPGTSNLIGPGLFCYVLRSAYLVRIRRLNLHAGDFATRTRVLRSNFQAAIKTGSEETLSSFPLARQ